MFKALLTLVRGGASAVGSEIADRNALLILDQQLRDATVALERAKRALALAIAQDQQEGLRLATVERQIADLEGRVLAALEGGRDELARDGAEAIARLEADRDATTAARSLFAAEIARLRNHVSQAEARIAAVDRGRRVARAAETMRHVRRGRVETSLPHQATLAEAEQTLKRLRARQDEVAIAEDALDQIDSATTPAAAAERLAAEGFGPPMRATAEDVIARLKLRGPQQKPAVRPVDIASS
jgi:phage shock protein A